MDDELEPCECGGKSDRFIYAVSGEFGGIDFGIKCASCGKKLVDTTFRPRPTKLDWKRVERAWNSRKAGRD